LNDLAEKTPRTQDYVNYKGININRLLLKATRKYYEMGLKVYTGREVVRHIESIQDSTSMDEILLLLSSNGEDGKGKWIECCGMFSPESKITSLMEDVKSKKISSIDQLLDALEQIWRNYDHYAWDWCTEMIGQQTGIALKEMNAEGLIRVISEWKINAVKFNNMILKDAEKEFDISSKLGFGIDGDEQTRDQDFYAVRGAYNENKFVLDIQKETKEIESKADRLISLLEKLR
jgi:hypothetical protein